MFVPDSVSVPVPILVRPPVPDATPEKVGLAFSPPVVSVFAPSTTLPAPPRLPIVSDAFSCSVAPDAIVTAPVSDNALPPATASVPALIANAVGDAAVVPVSVQVPLPCFTPFSKLTTCAEPRVPAAVPSSTSVSVPAPPSSVPVTVTGVTSVTVSLPDPPVNPPFRLPEKV